MTSKGTYVRKRKVFQTPRGRIPDPDWREIIRFILRSGYSRAAISRHGGLTKAQIRMVMDGHRIQALYTTGLRTMELYEEAKNVCNANAKPVCQQGEATGGDQTATREPEERPAHSRQSREDRCRPGTL